MTDEQYSRKSILSDNAMTNVDRSVGSGIIHGLHPIELTIDITGRSWGGLEISKVR